MQVFRNLFLSTLPFTLFSGFAFAGVTVSSPGNGAQVSSPFTLSADAVTCSSQPVAAMGYSFDSSASTTILYTDSIDQSVTSATGQHTLHVKAWGNQGASCVTDIALNIEQNPLQAALSIPIQALSVSSIQALSNWIGTNDSAGSGRTNGHTSVVGFPSLVGNTRQFVTNFWNSGAERFYASFGDDTTSTNFLYDAFIYLNNTSSKIANLEFDLNQVTPNGQTVIYGVQCDGWTSTWDYTANAGTPTKPVDVWVHSNKYCNPRTWSTNVWHHVQMSYSRNGSGQVTYNTIYLDGLAMPINATVNSSFALGWAPTLLTNFQIDGYGSSGSATAYLDNLTVYRW
jgi:hypothetical protein